MANVQVDYKNCLNFRVKRWRNNSDVQFVQLTKGKKNFFIHYFGKTQNLAQMFAECL